MRPPTLYRPLRVFAFDPTQGRHFGNHMTIDVKYEHLRPGPVGQYLKVIDYDASNNCYYDPVDLDDSTVLLQRGVDLSESDPHFHQQMVYAVASETIRRFEFGLGRKIRWGFRGGRKGDQDRRLLRIFPHAMQEANAFYSREQRALLFGYFPASETDPGSNLPGQTVFTCLSHDIIAHETTHALIDGQREHFMDPTGPDTFAFHEAFADLVALFQHFSYKEALLETVQRSGGLLHRFDLPPDVTHTSGQAMLQAELAISNPLTGLAKQYGEAMGMRKALRSALGTRADSSELDKTTEPHARGAILVAAVFDAFFTAYFRRTADLIRIGSADRPIEGRPLHFDLANRLANEAAKTASHFCNICIRSLDYCPPVDITFGDFLRAVITADRDIVPDDDLGYRDALISAFRSRGIRPEGVTSFSEDALLWRGPEEIHGGQPKCEGLQFDPFHPGNPRTNERNARLLSRFGRNKARYLGLAPGLKVQAHSFHPLVRIGPDDGQPKVQIVVELLQQKQELLDPTDKKSGATFRGGSTIVLDENGSVCYAIQKRIGSPTRLERWRQVHDEDRQSSSLDAYGKPFSAPQFDFSLIHRGF